MSHVLDETWCTIESDPGVFTELIESIGVRGVQVDELYSLDEASFAPLHPIYGLVFLFKWTGEMDERPTVDPIDYPELFFARQVIPNACATQAILSVILNVSEKINLGEVLTEFKSFTAEFPSDMKGLAISNSDQIRRVHNSFVRLEPFYDDNKPDEHKNEDAFHFIAYVQHKDKVFELDGLKPGPIILGDVPGAGQGGNAGKTGSWLDVASPAIEERIARYSSGEIRFNLMAVVKNRRQVASEHRQLCLRRVATIDAALNALSPYGEAPIGYTVGPDGIEREHDTTFPLEKTEGGLERQKTEQLSFAQKYAQTMAEEERKLRMWRNENVRRRHNYVPFAVTLLRRLAEKGELEEVMDAAKIKAEDRRAARAESKKGEQHE